jgi:hypothetical protein
MKTAENNMERSLKGHESVTGIGISCWKEQPGKDPWNCSYSIEWNIKKQVSSTIEPVADFSTAVQKGRHYIGE